VNAQPTEQLSVGLSAWRSVSDYGSPSAGDENRRRSTPADESIATDYDVYGVKLGYDFAGLTLTSSTGYLHYNFGSDLDYFYPFTGGALSGVLFTGMTSRIFSQEVVLNSADEGAWRWSVGGAYRDGKDSLRQTLFIFAGPIAFSDTSKSFALFGELTRRLLDGRFELTGGLRYFKDRVTHIEDVAQAPALPTDPVLPPNRAEFHKTSPRVVFSWHPGRESTVYASYSEGFRSGFNQNSNIIRLEPDWPALKPDNLKNYELGAKGSWLGGRVTYDSAVYFIDWQDVQQALTVNFAGAPLAALVNSESASGLGAELGVNAQPVRGLQLGVSVSWNDLEADHPFVPAPGVDIQGLYGAGDRLNFSSKYTAGVTAAYTFPLSGSAYQGRFSISGNYSSKQTYRNILAGALVVDVGEAQTIARSSFSVESPHNWTATLFVDNLGNEQDPGVGLFHIPDWTQRARPRTVGLQFEYDFN
jgi:outer membrane receptor protein involved in Fe transport